LYEGSPDNGTYLFSNFTLRLRPDKSKINPKYLAHFLASSKAEADRRKMAQDTTGLRNLKTREYLAQSLPLPPLPEQQRLVEKIERLLEQSRTAREALDSIPPLLKRFRQAVLAKAFRGELTERDPGDEPASVLLERVREERRRKWEEDLRAKGRDPRKAKYIEPDPPDTSALPELPEG
jgi:type I restriction enzyme S subunit